MKNTADPKTSISHVFAEFRRGESRIAHAKSIFDAAVKAVDSFRAVRDTVGLAGDVLHIRARDARTASYNLDCFKRIFIIGCGKASAPMAAAMEDILKDRINAGIVVVKHGHTLPGRTLDHIKVIKAGHPEPDRRGMKAARAIRDLLKRADASDLVIALVSGGGSALLPLPPPGISLGDLVRMTRLLIGCGADIAEINTIRKHLSAIQGGRAARLAFPAQVMVLAVSDVINNDFHTIASGPFIGDPGTFKDAWDIIQKYQLEKAAPRRIIRYLRRNLRSIKAETPKPGDPVFANVRHALCASNRQSLAAAAAMAENLGYRPKILDAGLSGDVRRAASTTTKVNMIVTCI
jgi:hydroxypyruvate reductase